MNARTSQQHGDRGRSRLVRRALALSVPMLAVSATLLLPPGLPAAADPPLTIAEAKTQITQLETEAAAIDQDYVGVKEELDNGRAKLTTKQADVRKQVAKVAQMRIQVGQVALAQFQNRNLDTTAQLFFTRDTDGFLSQMSTVEKVSENQNTVLQDFQAEQANLASLERSAETDLAALKAQEDELKKLRKQSDTKIVESKAVLAKLTEEERQAIAAEEARVAAVARREAEEAAAVLRAAEAAAAAQKGSNPRDNSGTDTSTGSTGSTGPVSGRGSTALAFARAQLGKSYRFAAAGPDAYDCSGLTSAAWRAAGVSLARTARAQSGNGRAVSKSELRPGDLVFFYSPISHVGLYAGDGQIIQSSRPGKPVGYASISAMPFAGARRPG